MAYKIQIRRDTATNWTSVNPTLGQGELGYETNSGKLKVGDGAKTWAQLDYLIGENDGSIDLGAVDKHVLPATDNVYDLGSPTKQWRELYVSGGSIYVGDIKISNQTGRLIFTQVTNPGQVNEAPVPGGTEAFELPVASDTLLGAVKIGDNLTITPDGTLNAQQGDYELPTASNVVKGGILIGDNLTIDGQGYLSATVPDISNFITAEDIPAIPADISDLTDTTNLLGSGSADVGNFTFNDGTTQTTAYVPEDNLVKISDEWAVTDGTDTYSFTVPSDGTYIMWVKGNIPNGIITWNATASVSNTNVPAIGSQYAWNYTGGGSPILLTSIPDQIKGVAGTISTDSTYAGTTSNRFDFGISNTTGSTQTVYYGYTKIS